MKIVFYWSEVTATTIADWFIKAWFLKNVSSGEDDPLSKLKEPRTQLQQHDKNFVPENFDYDDLLAVDNGIVVVEV